VHKSGSAIAIYVYESAPDMAVSRQATSTTSGTASTPSAEERTESERTAEKYDAILKLDDLRKRGLITDQEFESEKQKILSSR
jgi:hypothetical protein